MKSRTTGRQRGLGDGTRAQAQSRVGPDSLRGALLTGTLMFAMLMLGTILLAGTAGAQTTNSAAPILGLATAQQRARANGYAARAAQGSVTSSEGRSTATLQGLLPSMHVEAGYGRTNDPLGAFGSTLRQRNVSEASFSPSLLNNPAAIGNASSALVMELPLINADAWRGRQAAQRAVEASEASRDWSLDEATLQTTQAYFAAVYAKERADAFEAALAAAASQVRQTASQLRNGVVTQSDALLAEVHQSQVKSALVAAKADAEVARARLAMTMGTPEDMSWRLPESLPDTKRIIDLAASAYGTGADGISTDGISTDGASRSSGSASGGRAVGGSALGGSASSASAFDATQQRAMQATGNGVATPRSDVQAARLAAEAAQLSESGTRAAYLPRVNAVVRMDRNTPNNVFGGRGSWTLGVMMSWAPFANPALIGSAQSERGRVTSSQAQADAATARARLEVLQTRSALTVALAQLDIVEQTLQQGVEAHRIVSRKYDGGIATITDLLNAAAVETETRLGVVDARYRALNAIAEQLHARGATLARLAAIDSNFRSN